MPYDDFFTLFWWTFWGYFAFWMLIALAIYVFIAISLYSMASRRGIRHAWLAWVPIGNNWILGSLSDQYRYLVKGKICRKRMILPALSGGILLLIPVMSRMVTVNAALGALFDCYFSAASTLLGSVFLALAVIAILIVVQVFFYIAVYDVYRSCDPDNATLFLILTIVVPLCYPILLFCCRKKELGMPPRRPRAPGGRAMNEVNETWAPVFLFLVAIALIFVYHWVLEGIAYQAMARRAGPAAPLAGVAARGPGLGPGQSFGPVSVPGPGTDTKQTEGPAGYFPGDAGVVGGGHWNIPLACIETPAIHKQHRPLGKVWHSRFDAMHHCADAPRTFLAVPISGAAGAGHFPVHCTL